MPFLSERKFELHVLGFNLSWAHCFHMKVPHYFQIKSLKLGEELLQGRFSKDVISRYEDREPLSQQCRLELTKTYVKCVVGMYCEWFGNRYVGPEIIQYVAEVMITLYPSLTQIKIILPL